jgi:hypothetical protein
MKKYGDALICVRFRYDPETRQRLKTVELVVERSDWTPPPCRFTNDSLVPLRIISKVKEAGGRWNPEKQLWFVSYGKVVGTALEKHIDVDGLNKCETPDLARKFMLR